MQRQPSLQPHGPGTPDNFQGGISGAQSNHGGGDVNSTSNQFHRRDPNIFSQDTAQPNQFHGQGGSQFRFSNQSRHGGTQTFTYTRSSQASNCSSPMLTQHSSPPAHGGSNNIDNPQSTPMIIQRSSPPGHGRSNNSNNAHSAPMIMQDLSPPSHHRDLEDSQSQYQASQYLPSQLSTQSQVFTQGFQYQPPPPSQKPKKGRKSTALNKETPQDTANKKGRLGNYNATEDLALCRAWVAVSEDPVIGTGQQNNRFWERIQETYNLNPGNDRSIPSLQSHWGPLQKSLSKFAAAIEQVKGFHASGKSTQNLIGDAHAYYLKVEGHEFKHYQCYDLVSNSPKWNASINDQNEKKKNDNPETNHASSSNERPIGTKAAKQRLKLPPPPTQSPEIAELAKTLVEASTVMAKHTERQTQAIELISQDSFLRGRLDDIDPADRDLFERRRAKVRKEMEAYLADE